MNNIEEKYKLTCLVTNEKGYCAQLDDDGNEHGEYIQQVFKKKTRPYGWTNEEFYNWQYPKKDDPLCPKCRKKIIACRNEQYKKDSMDTWLSNMTQEQQLDIKNYVKDQKSFSEQEEQIRRTKGFVTSTDYRAIQAGDKND